MTHLNRIVLNRPVVGLPSPEDFRLETSPLPEVADGQVLFKTHWCSVDPGTRARLSAGASYAAPLAEGDVIDGFCLGEVTQSRHPKFAEGSVWAYGGGWADHHLSTGRGYLQPIPDLGVPLTHWIGVLGVPGMTAWFGLKRVAEIALGARVLVSSAAGPVGATAGQLAKVWEAERVVGLAGGAAKCAWVEGTARFDQCIDYKATTDLTAALHAASPEGYDVLFDNVGNSVIDAALPLMRPKGRIVVSGQVADYSAATSPGLTQTRWFIANRLRMEGIVVFDDLKAFPAAQAELAALITAGTVFAKEEHFSGIEAIVPAFCGLFTGDSFGRRLVKLT